jgi:hypothetical protein
METLGTFKSFKYSWTEKPNVCRTAATMTDYCVVNVEPGIAAKLFFAFLLETGAND